MLVSLFSRRARWTAVATAAVLSLGALTLASAPAPALAASLAYFDMQRIQPLPTRMVNLQRGFFGSHNLKDRRSGRTFQIAWPGFKKS